MCATYSEENTCPYESSSGDLSAFQLGPKETKNKPRNQLLELMHFEFIV